MEIRELVAEWELREAVPVLGQPWSDADPGEVLACTGEDDYHPFGRFDGDELVGVAGVPVANHSTASVTPGCTTSWSTSHDGARATGAPCFRWSRREPPTAAASTSRWRRRWPGRRSIGATGAASTRSGATSSSRNCEPRRRCEPGGFLRGRPTTAHAAPEGQLRAAVPL